LRRWTRSRWRRSVSRRHKDLQEWVTKHLDLIAPDFARREEIGADAGE
jgi:hypothetical protein